MWSWYLWHIPRFKPSSQLVAVVHMPTFLFFCNGKLQEEKTRDWVPGLCGRDLDHLQLLRKIQNRVSFLRRKDSKSRSKIPNQTNFFSSSSLWTFLIFAQSKRELRTRNLTRWSSNPRWSPRERTNGLE